MKTTNHLRKTTSNYTQLQYYFKTTKNYNNYTFNPFVVFLYLWFSMCYIV